MEGYFPQRSRIDVFMEKMMVRPGKLICDATHTTLKYNQQLLSSLVLDETSTGR